MNAGRHSHGIADPNLSLASWRAAVVVNAIAGSPVYPLPSSRSVCRWNPTAPSRRRAPAGIAARTAPGLAAVHADQAR
jgi:lysine N6-hydroxylase